MSEKKSNTVLDEQYIIKTYNLKVMCLRRDHFNGSMETRMINTNVLKYHMNSLRVSLLFISYLYQNDNANNKFHISTKTNYDFFHLK